MACSLILRGERRTSMNMPRALGLTTCPSASCSDGTHLIGIIGSDGRVQYLGRPTPIDVQFVSVADAGTLPESRFRFAEACARERCGHWAGQVCSLVERITEAVPPNVGGTVLPACGIRRSCVWYKQVGARACVACPAVVHSAASV